MSLITSTMADRKEKTIYEPIQLWLADVAETGFDSDNWGEGKER